MPANDVQFTEVVVCLGKAVRVEVYNSDEILTERDYLAIGLCAGFLVLLYIFVMIVLIIMKKKQRRDARLREQFLNMPLPSGLGYKSSRILGLEEEQEKNKVGLNDEVRYSTKSKSFSQMEPKITRDLARMQNGIADKEEEKIYDITKVNLWYLLAVYYQLLDFYVPTYHILF